MVKNSALLVTLLSFSVVGQLMSSEDGQTNKKYLNFLVNFDRKDMTFPIEEFSERRMSNYLVSKDCIGENLFTVLHIKEYDSIDLLSGFMIAMGRKREVKVSYRLEKKDYVAKIVPLLDLHGDTAKTKFSVTVKEDAAGNK